MSSPISIVSQLKSRLSYSNIHELPYLDKIVVSMWVWSIVTKKWLKDLSEFEKNMMKITWQKPITIKSKQAISNFKLREGMPVMLKVTLRKSKAAEFIQRLTALVLPRIRDFSWVSSRSFDQFGNYNLGLKTYTMFPEFGLDDVSIPMWLQITFVIRSKKQEDSKILLESYGLIFN